MKKPTARVVSEVCSLCGLDWKRHGDAPTVETCVELLLAEVRALNAQVAHRPTPAIFPPVVLPLVPHLPFRPLSPWMTKQHPLGGVGSSLVGRSPAPPIRTAL